MLEDVARYTLSFGISGLLFVMWWYERKERVQQASDAQRAHDDGQRLAELNGRLLDVIRTNTEALVALREELRWQRQSEPEWTQRLVRQLEQVCERLVGRPRWAARAAGGE